MSCHNEGCGCGKFFVGMGLGLMVGAGLGMTMSPSRRQVRRVAHKAAQRVNEVVDDLADAMGQQIQGQPRKHDPPGHFLPQGVHELAPPDLFDQADGHAGDDLDKAQGHGPHQDHHGVVQGSGRRWRG